MIKYLQYVFGEININFVHNLVVVENLSQKWEELLHVNSFGYNSKKANKQGLHLLYDVLNVHGLSGLLFSQKYEDLFQHLNLARPNASRQFDQVWSYRVTDGVPFSHHDFVVEGLQNAFNRL